MRIVDLQAFRADGGWRPFSFLKVVTDEGLVGWAEFVEGPWSPALREVILALDEFGPSDEPVISDDLEERERAPTPVSPERLQINDAHVGFAPFALTGQSIARRA